jgi:hypothetical protein
VITIRKIAPGESDPAPDRWRDYRATYAVVTAATDRGFSEVTMPEVDDDGYTFLLSWGALPPDALPLQVGDQLAVTARRRYGPLGAWWEMIWHGKVT